MKKIILGISILGMSFGIQAQTNVAIGTGGTTTASDFYYNSTTKNVGIGVVPSIHKLSLYRSGSTDFNIQASFTNGNIIFSDDYWGSTNVIRSSASVLAFGQGSNANSSGGGTFTSRMAIDTNTGNIGIATTPTNHRLTVADPGNVSSIAIQSFYAEGNILFSDDFHGSFANIIKSYDSTLSFGRGTDSASAHGGTFTSHMAIDTNTGNVGIGTTTTGSHKLTVEGSIGAREIKVEVGTWSDFVFDKTYKLPTLKEVEAHILENGHLENIPSEAEVLENGIYLGDMNAKLLQKIEELTLYTIDQEKQLKSQNTTINTLAAKLLELQLEIEKLKNKQ